MKRTYDCRLRKVGNSYIITIPISFIRKNKLKLGELVEVRLSV